MWIAVSAQRDKHVKSFSWRNSNVQALTVGNVLSSLGVQNWCNLTAPLVSKMKGIWRQVSWGHLSKHAKCFPNNSWELQPSPAEVSLPAFGEGFLCTVPAAQILQVTSNRQEGLSPGVWLVHGTNYRLFISEWDHSVVIPQCSLCPVSAEIPGLQSWRSIVVWSRFRKPTAEGTFRWWLQKGSPTIC